MNDNQWSVDGASGCLVPAGKPGPFRTSVRWNAAVDRLSGASERHATACIEFREGCGLWTVVGFRDEAARDRWQEPVKAAFRLLADSGFGGERSRGWGRSETPEFVEGMLPGLIIEYKRGSRRLAPVEEPPTEEPPIDGAASDGRTESRPEYRLWRTDSAAAAASAPASAAASPGSEEAASGGSRERSKLQASAPCRRDPANELAAGGTANPCHGRALGCESSTAVARLKPERRRTACPTKSRSLPR